jgi:hypothetical protein
MTNGHPAGSSVSFPANSGGAILNNHATLTVSNCIVIGNLGYYGGGIYNYSEGGRASLKVVSSVLSRNSASNRGGGIMNDGNPSIPFGPSGTASVQIVNTTLSGNYADTYGGGIMSDGLHGSASAQIISSTLSSNSARLLGGGIFNQDERAYGGDGLLIVNSTMSGNFDNYGGLGFAGEIYTAGDMHIHNCTLNGYQIVNDSGSLEIGSTILNGVSEYNGGTITSLGYNLFRGETGGYPFLTDPTDQINTDPLLGPLQDNGGPTFTHAPLPGSPAIDKGTNFSASATDQRGFARTLDIAGLPNAANGDGTDIGAIESQDASLRLVNFGTVLNQFGFNLVGPFTNVVVEACTNLPGSSWTALATNTLGDAVSRFTDPVPSTLPQRFYRARLP